MGLRGLRNRGHALGWSGAARTAKILSNHNACAHGESAKSYRSGSGLGFLSCCALCCFRVGLAFELIAGGALWLDAGGLFGCWLVWCWGRCWPGLGPAADLLFFASPKKSRQKKGDPTFRIPFAALRGNLRCSRAGCRRRTRFAAAQRRSNNCGESDHEAWTSFGVHAHPARCASQHGQRGEGSQTGHRCARLGW